MATASIKLIEAIRNTIHRLKVSDSYQWGHMGGCNCGFLAQEITKLSKAAIHSRAMQKYGDWNEQLNDYCPDSGMLMDDLISNMLAAGLDIDDLKHLEKLSDQNILIHLPKSKRHLAHNKKEDVIMYLSAWVQLMEAELIAHVQIPDEGVSAW